MRGLRAGATVVLLAACACAPPARVPAPEPAALREQSLEPNRGAHIEVIGLREVADADARIVTVVGTVVNHGDRETEALTIRVQALDESGRVVAVVAGVPDEEHLPPHDGATRFTATFPNRAEIRGYRAEALARW